MQSTLLSRVIDSTMKGFAKTIAEDAIGALSLLVAVIRPWFTAGEKQPLLSSFIDGSWVICFCLAYFVIRAIVVVWKEINGAGIKEVESVLYSADEKKHHSFVIDEKPPRFQLILVIFGAAFMLLLAGSLFGVHAVANYLRIGSPSPAQSIHGSILTAMLADTRDDSGFHAIYGSNLATPIAIALYVRLANSSDISTQIVSLSVEVLDNKYTSDQIHAKSIPPEMRVFGEIEGKPGYVDELQFKPSIFELLRQPLAGRSHLEGWILLDVPAAYDSLTKPCRYALILRNAIGGEYLVDLGAPEAEDNIEYSRKQITVVSRIPRPDWKIVHYSDGLPPNEHTRVSWLTPSAVMSRHSTPLSPLLPFHKGETPTLNVGFKNSGDFPVLDPTEKVIIAIVPFGSQTAFQDYSSKLNAEPGVPGGVLNPHQGVARYATYHGPILTDDDVVKLTTPRVGALCALGKVGWKDSTGEYETDVAQCFVAETPQPDAGFNWHILKENDAEHKVK
jgi:hypothetical protein